jgi:hypothetical protein
LLDGADYVKGSYCLSNAFLEKIVSAAGTANSGTTLSYQRYWGGCIATFKAAAAGTAHYVTATEFFGALDSKTRAKTAHRTLIEHLGALDSKSRIKTVHRALTELLGALDTKTRVKTVHRAFTELLGVVDSKVLSRLRSVFLTFTEILGVSDAKTKTKSVYRTFTERLGALDAKTRAKSVFRTFTELFGALDSKILSRVRSVFLTFTEYLGASDSRTRVKSIYRVVTEKLGALDARTRTKSIFRTITEKLGLSDAFGKTKESPVAAKKWGYTIPFSVFRKLGLSGVVIRPKGKSLGLKAVLLDREKATMGVLGKALNRVKVEATISTSRLTRKKAVGLHGISLVSVGQRSTVHGRLLRPAESSAKLVGEQRFDLVAGVLGLSEATSTFMFVAVMDDLTCQACMQHDTKTYTQDDIQRLFPYAQAVDYSLWMVNLHPGCRCFLVLLEIGA